MDASEKKHTASEQRLSLLTLCRFLAVRLIYRFMLLSLSATGLILTLTHRTQFAPYGIVLLCLILPSFLSDFLNSCIKKENTEPPLSILYRRYHYSPIKVTEYRITLSLCIVLLLIWHKVQAPKLILSGISVPLLYAVLFLALYPILSRGLFLCFHYQLMRGKL